MQGRPWPPAGVGVGVPTQLPRPAHPCNLLPTCAPSPPLPRPSTAGSSRVGARCGATALVDPQTEAELAASGLPGA